MNSRLPPPEGTWAGLITDPAENGCVDYKGPMAWSSATRGGLAKDIAAFANSQGGGMIVVGLRQVGAGVFEREGLSSEQAESFETTRVLNWINERFQPPIRAECRRIRFENKDFIVISVQQFGDIPCLCTKEYSESGKPPTLRRGALYVRTDDASCRELERPQELRDLIHISVRNQADRFAAITRQLLTAGTVDEPAGAANRDRQLAIIRRSLDLDPPPERGWVLQFSILPFSESRWPDEARLREVVQRSRASLLDPFPHGYGQPAEYGLRESLDGLYRWYVCYSGAFVCWLGDESDVAAEVQRDTGRRDLLDWKWTVYTLSSFFSFMADIAFEAGGDASVEYEVRRGALQGRKLFLGHPLFPGGGRYTKGEFRRSRTQSIAQLRTDRDQECAWTLMDLLDGFDGVEHWGRWGLRDPQMVRGQVRAALERKL